MQYLILKRILERIPVPDYIYAFEVGKNIPAMAAKHVGKKIVISLDIKDFFPSIKQARVLEVLKNAGIGQSAAVTISELCTYKAFVPQGALTSPKVSNIVAATTFGPEVKELCDRKGYTMTIYADDITISSDSPIPNAIDFVTEIQSIVNKHGFRINYKKTKIMSDKVRQWVCGVVTNVKTNMLKKERLRLRAIVYNMQKNGIEAEAAKSQLEPDKFINLMQGKINWYRQLNPQVGGRLYDKFKDLKPSISQATTPSFGAGEMEVPAQ